MYDTTPEKYTTDSFTFVTTPGVRTIKGNKGKEGLLVDYGFEQITTTFAGVTGPAISIGTLAAPAAYGTLINAGPAAPAAAAGTFAVLTETIAGSTTYNTYMVNRKIPRDTTVYITLAVGTAGVAKAFVKISWDR